LEIEKMDKKLESTSGVAVAQGRQWGESQRERGKAPAGLNQ